MKTPVFIALLAPWLGCEAAVIEVPICDVGPEVQGEAPGGGGATDPEWPEDELLPAAFQTPPYLTLLDPTTVVVSWRATPAAAATVRLGTGAVLSGRIDAPLAVQHHVTLFGLRPATSHCYEVDIAGAVRRGVFVTPGSGSVRMVQLGEFHAPSNSAEAAAFGPIIREFRPHLLVESGDMVDDGEDMTHWVEYLRSSAAWISNVLLLPAHSNHVGTAGGIGHMQCLFDLDRMWFATRFGPVEVLSIASESLDEFHSDEVPWIRRQAELAHDGDDDPAFLLAAWHHPACSSNYASRKDKREWVMDNIVGGLVAGGGVDLILVGHDKYYERSTLSGLPGQQGDIVHVMTNVGRISPGTAGDNHAACTPVLTDLDDNSALLISVDATTLQARAVRQDGSTIDEFELLR